MPSWPALRGKVLAFRRREGVPCSSQSYKSEILAMGKDSHTRRAPAAALYAAATHDVIKSRLLTVTFTTAAFD